MDTTATPAADHVVLDGNDNVVETGISRVAALRLIDWMSVNDKAAGPFRCVPIEDAR